ncbi:hypothetical protein [Pseudacidovorax intermedius]|uniref:Uncharacterized protein n=1 Tax=Pseudacidovorax intermedius TaxID=433924 RepID=A0A370FDQ6_9BURK|nr:hypothetical protein [Pseudacidovorax intermedius]RDI24176.1 hypothetical protein DFR41_10591 [Pseudacidovorax intermedius]
MPSSASPQTAILNVSTRPFSISAKVEVTPGGMLAIAALVTGILLSTAVIVRVAKS